MVSLFRKQFIKLESGVIINPMRNKDFSKNNSFKIIIMSIFVCIAVFGFLSVSNKASAQVQNTDITLSVSPSYPTPGQNTTATLSSYVTDLNKANISWSINNEEVGTGVGQKTLTFNAPEIGSTLVINARIETISGQTLAKNITIEGNGVDMLWQAVDSYVPPFYKGKALGSKEGSFKIVAIPNVITKGERISSNNLAYTWRKDGNGQPGASGWGKSFFVYKNSYIDPTNSIEVKVADVFGNTNTQGKIRIAPTQPKIVLYKKGATSNTTLSNNIQNGFTLSKDGETIVAIPYFFSTKNINFGELRFNWSINGAPATPGSIKNELRVKGAEGGTGQAKIDVDVTNSKARFQGNFKRSIDVNF